MAVRVVVDSRVRLDKESIEALPDGAFEAMKTLCLHDNPEFLKWIIFRKGKGYPPAKQVKSYKKESKGSYSFPRGLAEQIIALCGPDVHIADRRLNIAAPTCECKGPPLYEHQKVFVDHGLKADATRAWAAGLWRAPPGSGKTQAILYLASKLGLKTLVVVPTTKIFDQWVKRVRSSLGIEPGVIKGKNRNIGEIITIAMQKTLWNHAEEFTDKFGAVLADEAQLFAAKTCREVIDLFPAIFRMAVSGDERRADKREFLIYDQFGPVFTEVTRDDAKAANGIVDVEVVVVPTDFEAEWYRSLEPDIKFLRRAELIDQIQDSGKRTALAVSIAKNCFNNDGEQVAVLTSRRDHCERISLALNSHRPAVILMGDDKNFDENHKLFSSGLAKYAACTFQAVGVGFESHAALARGVFATPVVSTDDSRMQFFQYLGRFARPFPGKLKGVVYYLLDHKVFGEKPASLINQWLGDDLSSVLDGGVRVPVKEWVRKKRRDREESEEDSRSSFGRGKEIGRDEGEGGDGGSRQTKLLW